jgi:hypothetical protein
MSAKDDDAFVKVKNKKEKHLKTVIWLLPLYLLIFNLFVCKNKKLYFKTTFLLVNITTNV